MAVTATLKARGSGAGSTITSGSFTTSTGKYYLLCYRNGIASGYPTSVSTTAGTISFTTINSATSGALATRIYGGYCTAGGTGTASASRSSSSNAGFAIIELSGITATGAIVQSTNATGSSTSLTSTLSAFGDVTNATLFMMGALGGGSAPTPESGFTKVADDGNIPNVGYAVFFNPGNDTTPSATLSPSTTWTTVALEIKCLRSDTLTHYPSAVSTTGGSTTWSNTGNVYSSDNSYATVNPDVTASNNTYIDITGFNLSYPAGTVVAVTADIEASYTGTGAPKIESVQLLKAGSTAGTLYNPATALTTSDIFYTPTTADLWGTTISTSDANNSGFGVRLRFQGGQVLNDTYVTTPGQGYTSTITSGGGASQTWSNPTNAGADDSTYAVMTAPSATPSNNDYLKFSNFGFSLPSNATVVSIWVQFEKSRNGGTAGNIRTDTLQLTKAGSLVGSNLADTATNWAASDVLEIIDDGGVSQLWGTTWTYSDVNNSGFGLWVRPYAVDASTSTSATFSTTAADAGGGSVAWVNTSNANASDSTYASQTATGSSSNTAADYNYLHLTGYGFSIPSNATITGVTASIRRLRNGGSTGEVRFNTIQLIKGGTRGGTNLAGATNFPTTVAAVSFGGTTNLWGNTLAYSDVNASNFGIAIRLVGSTAGTNRVGNIDSASLTITYTTPSSRDARVDRGQVGVYYNIPGTSTIQLDTVRLNVTATGVVTCNSNIIEADAVSVAAVKRTRKFAYSISESLALAFAALTISHPFKFFAFSLTEAEAMTDVLSRLRKDVFTVAETETFTTTAMKRTRHIQDAITEAETVSVAKLMRAKKIALTIIETEALAIALHRARQAAFTISELESVTASILKLKGIKMSVAELEAFTGNIRRARHDVTAIAEVIADTFNIRRQRNRTPVTIAEVESLTDKLARTRKVIPTIVETETVSGKLARLKKAGFAFSEAFNDQFTLSKYKALKAALAETDTFSFGTIRRTRRVAESITETANYVFAKLKRTKKFAFTEAQVEAINAALKRAQHMKGAIAEIEGVSDKLSRARHVKTAITELETLTIPKLARLKLIAYVCSETNNHQFWLSRLKKFNPQTIAEVETIQTNFNRARALNGSINEDEQFTVNFIRLRNQLVSINETQGTDAMLSRLREIAYAIEQTTEYVFDISIRLTDPASVDVTITYATWLNTFMSIEDSTYNLITRTETMSFVIKTKSTSSFVFDSASTVDIEDETESIVVFKEDMPTIIDIRDFDL